MPANSTAFSAVVSLCRSRAHWHKANGLKTSDISHLNVQLQHQDRSAFNTLRALKVEEYEVNFDWDRRFIEQPIGHNDPLFLVEMSGQPCLEISIYDHPQTLAGHLDLELINASGDVIEVKSRLLNQDFINRITSNVDWQWPIPILEITAHQGGEIVWQCINNGHFEETRQALEPGTSTFEIPPNFSDYFGISISDANILGASEHKHILVGELGLLAPRPMMDAKTGAIRPANMTEPDKYRSLVLKDRSDTLTIDRLNELLTDWHSIEIVSQSDKPGWLNNHAEAARVRWRQA